MGKHPLFRLGHGFNSFLYVYQRVWWIPTRIPQKWMGVPPIFGDHHFFIPKNVWMSIENHTSSSLLVRYHHGPATGRRWHQQAAASPGLLNRWVTSPITPLSQRTGACKRWKSWCPRLEDDLTSFGPSWPLKSSLPDFGCVGDIDSESCASLFSPVPAVSMKRLVPPTRPKCLVKWSRADQTTIPFWLVVTGTWTDYDSPETVGNVSTPQLTFTPWFFRGVGWSTTNQFSNQVW